MTRWADKGFVAVDWGSSARRAYVLDGNGRVLDEMEDDLGTLTVPRREFGAAVEALRSRFGDAPMLMAGMVGSNRGWMEAPYVPCPASLADIAARLCWAEPGRVAIVPGASRICRGDTMPNQLCASTSRKGAYGSRSRASNTNGATTRPLT